MATPAVSVVLPVYRSGDFARQSIEKLRRQTRRDIEIVVVDDGSGDGTADAAELAASGDPRVRVLRQPTNRGVAAARRRGVEEARGEWLWFVDSDDDWPDDALDRLLAAAADDVDVVVAAAAFTYVDGSQRRVAAPIAGDVEGPAALGMLLRGEVTGHLWNKLFRTRTMAKASFAPARVQSDLAMVADALSHAGRVVFVPDHVYDYLLRPHSIITSVRTRSDSLALIDEAVTAAAARAGVAGSADHRYFRARYIMLSGIKDALLADYPDEVRRRHLAAGRKALTWREVVLLGRRRDVRRLALATSAKLSIPAHRLLLRVADR